MNIDLPFQSLSEFLDYSEQDHPSDTARPCASRDESASRAQFTQTKTKAEAYTLARYGWADGLERMRKVMEGITANLTLPSTRDVFLPSVEGCAPNIEAYIQGIPDDMFQICQIEEDAPPTQLMIQLEMGYSSFITAEQVMMAGAVVFAAMELLRVQGCNVTALLSWTSRAKLVGQASWQCTVPVPSTTDMDTLSFMFSHPAVLRRLVFSIQEHQPMNVREQFGFYQGGGYLNPSKRQHPDAQGMIAMQQICTQLSDQWSNNTETNYSRAQALLQTLVDTRFGTAPLPTRS